MNYLTFVATAPIRVKESLEKGLWLSFTYVHLLDFLATI